MGDFADDAMNRGIEEMEELESMLRKNASGQELMDAGHMLEDGTLLFGCGVLTSPKNTAKCCKHCGANGLEWRNSDKGWRLYDINGNMHSCSEYRR